MNTFSVTYGHSGDFGPFSLNRSLWSLKFGPNREYGLYQTTIKPENVIGMQCSTWSETLMNDYEMEVAIFPRVFACAERAYNPNPSFQSLHDVTNFKPLFENFFN